MSRKNIKISVLIPVFNAEKFLAECIESVIKQKHNNLEVLLINDGSTDNSLKIMKEYEKKDKRIKIINRENRGILKTRIECIEKATGEYILFVDSDDMLEKDAIPTFLKYDIEKYELIRTNYRVKIGEQFIFKQDFKKFKKLNLEIEQEKLYKDILKSSKYNTVWRELIKKEIIDLKNIRVNNISMGDDFLLNFKIYKNCKQILLLTDSTYIYRLNNNSITKTKNNKKILQNLKDIEDVYSYIAKDIDIISNTNNEIKNLFFQRYIKELNNCLYIIIQNNNSKEETLRIVLNTFDNSLLKIARNILKTKNIMKYKMFILMYFILKNKSIVYYKLCKKLQKIYKK